MKMSEEQVRMRVRNKLARIQLQCENLAMDMGRADADKVTKFARVKQMEMLLRHTRELLRQ